MRLPGLGLKRRRPRWVRDVLLVLMLGIIGAGIAAVASGRYQLRPVLSGSMAPGLPVGGVVVTERVPVSSLHVRDVIVIHRPDRPDELIVHRITALHAGAAGIEVQTAGDANSFPDPWKVTLRGTTAYRATFAVPWAGYVAVWAHGQQGRRLLLAAGLLLILGGSLASLVARRRQAKSPDPSNLPQPAASC